MTKYPCPICSRRACDSEKALSLAKLSESNGSSADIIIKCRSCKNSLVVLIKNEPCSIELISEQKTSLSLS